MQRISFAPVLSATLSRDSCWITSTPVRHTGSLSDLVRGAWWNHRCSMRDSRPARASRLLLGLLQDLHHAPALARRQRAGLHETDAVADATLVGLVVRLVVLRAADDLVVLGVLHAVLDGHDHGLVHLVADHQALQDLAAAPRLSLLGHSVPSTASS